MNNQDFDAYADHKRFNTKVADTWDAALSGALERTGRPSNAILLLDYGCGDGKYFAHLVRRGLVAENIHGLEVSSRRVDRCRQIGWANAKLLVPNAPLPYEDGTFDLINCMEVIEHIPAAEGGRVIHELHRVLKPGGVLLISTPNYPIKRFYDLCDAVLHRKWARLRDDPTHVTYFNHQRLSRLLGSYFARVEPWPFKPGFLHKRFPRPFFLHKLFFMCQV